MITDPKAPENVDLWERAAEWLDLPVSVLLEATYGPSEPRLTPPR